MEVSRYSNPFATCWTRPGALSFVFPPRQSFEAIVSRLTELNWRGQILGPHGSGKSTLLAALMPIVRNADRSVHVIDGYEQLDRVARSSVRAWSYLRGHGLLVTAHTSVGLSTVVEMTPDPDLVKNIVHNLTTRIPTPVTDNDIAASYARFGSNVREILFDLYIRHEQLQRESRTREVTAT
jgi:hypothetical protein